MKYTGKSMMSLAGRMLRAVRLYRPALWMYGTWMRSREYTRSLGTVRGLAALYVLRLRPRRVGRTVRLWIPGSRHALFLRRGMGDIGVFRQIFLDGQYDVEVLPPPRLLIDAGAHVGCASVFFACRYPQATILAIEPEEANFQLLTRNAAPYRNIVPIRAAVWGRPEVLTIANPGADSWEFRTRTGETGDADTIIGLTIDELIKWTGAAVVDVLKVDIEGSEKQVFSAGCEGWLGKVRSIFAELHDRFEPGCSEAFHRAVAPYGFNESKRGDGLILRRTLPGPFGGKLSEPSSNGASTAVAIGRQLGVSVAICTHNGAERLPETLKHVAAQKTPPDLEWEVLVIDNASTDDSGAVAERCWPADAPPPLRVVREPKLGLSYARERAFAEARHQIIAFVDDDNWVCPDWVAVASETMSNDPGIGVLGSVTEAAFEHEPPPWFDRIAHLFGLSCELNTGEPPMPFGAGMCVRKSAWSELSARGFRFMTVGRQGTRLSAGEDVELVCALLLAGWRSALEPSLKLKHFLLARRLTWPYARRLAREGGASSVALDAYAFASQDLTTISNRLRHSWVWHVAGELRHLIRAPVTTLRALVHSREGDLDVLAIEDRIGRLLGYYRMGRGYGEFHRTVHEARWRKYDLLPWYGKPRPRTVRS